MDLVTRLDTRGAAGATQCAALELLPAARRGGRSGSGGTAAAMRYCLAERQPGDDGGERDGLLLPGGCVWIGNQPGPEVAYRVEQTFSMSDERFRRPMVTKSSGWLVCLPGLPTAR